MLSLENFVCNRRFRLMLAREDAVSGAVATCTSSTLRCEAAPRIVIFFMNFLLRLKMRADVPREAAASSRGSISRVPFLSWICSWNRIRAVILGGLNAATSITKMPPPAAVMRVVGKAPRHKPLLRFWICCVSKSIEKMSIPATAKCLPAAAE